MPFRRIGNKDLQWRPGGRGLLDALQRLPLRCATGRRATTALCERATRKEEHICGSGSNMPHRKGRREQRSVPTNLWREGPMLRQLRKDGGHALRLRHHPDNDVQVIEARCRRRTRHNFTHSKHFYHRTVQLALFAPISTGCGRLIGKTRRASPPSSPARCPGSRGGCCLS